MNSEQAKRIPLEEILGRYGHDPAERRGHDVWYKSPFREERTPSFVVNTQKNVWLDHGEGVGGNGIDLVSRLTGEDRIAEILRIVSGFTGAILSERTLDVRQEDRKRALSSSPVVSDRELSRSSLVEYLRSREIPAEHARSYVREIEYDVRGKRYFGIGFSNASGGYEVRNPYFKGCVGTKDISIVFGSVAGVVNVFEGFIDFLSWPLLDGHPVEETALVLNSVSLVSRAVAYFREHPCEEIRLFLDHDEAGTMAAKCLRESLPNCRIVDMSERYIESEDVNAELVRVERRRRELGRVLRNGP